MEDNPRLRVGLPVYNGENFIEATLEAILAQTYAGFTLIISDNASTDTTPAIIERYAAADERITVVRHPANLGAAPNYNAAYAAAGASEYFCWIAHDDIPLPRYFEACVTALDSEPEAVVAFAETLTIDPDGEEIGREPSRPLLASPEAHIRLADAIDHHVGNHPVFGVMRRSALDRTRLHGSYTGSDRTLLAELAMLGPFVEIPEVLFAIREHPERSVRAHIGAEHTRDAWFDTSRADRIVFPRWKRLGHYVMAVATAPVDTGEKLRSAGSLSRWLIDTNWKLLVIDLTTAARQVVRRLRA